MTSASHPSRTPTLERTIDDDLGSLGWLLRDVARAPAIDAELAARHARLDQLPLRLDEFELLAELGRGGMGRVFRARDEALGRDVAVKVLRPVADAHSLDAALAREATRTAALDHPNIVTVYRTGCAEGLSYMVVELVEGESLAQQLARGPLTRGELRVVAADLLGALAHAHARGLVHRDIKPQNLMLGPSGRVRVLDFGIALPLGEADGSTPAGTPAYMAPELFRGAAASPASDVWAAALVLLEAATTPSLARWQRARLTTADSTTTHPRHRARSYAARLNALRRRHPALAEVLAPAFDPEPTARPSAKALQSRVLEALEPPRGRRVATWATAGLLIVGGLGGTALAPTPPEIPSSVEGYFTSRRDDASLVLPDDAPDVTGTWRYTQAQQLPFELTVEREDDHLALQITYLRPPGRTDVRPTIRGPGYLVRVDDTLLIAAELDVDPALREGRGITELEFEVLSPDRLRLTKRIGVERASREVLIVSSLDEDVRRVP